MLVPMGKSHMNFSYSTNWIGAQGWWETNKANIPFILQFSRSTKGDWRVAQLFHAREKCTVKYKDLDYVVQTCMKFGENVPFFMTKTDLRSTFDGLPVMPLDCSLLVMQFAHPVTGKILCAVDKNLPFGHSISCSHFQRFSESLRHILEFLTGKHFHCTCYLDDYLFVEHNRRSCNDLVSKFLKLCEFIGFPVALDKTEWASTSMVFLGILIDGTSHSLVMPQEKCTKALNLIRKNCDAKKATVNELQSLAGVLNFITKAVHLGRAFTRRMYAKFGGVTDKKIEHFDHPKNKQKWTEEKLCLFKLKPYHHVYLDSEFRFDCKMW